MGAKNTLQVFEYELVKPGFARKGVVFEQKHLEALQRFFKTGCPYFSLTYNGVKFCEMVGVLQVGELTIEVLPKTERHAGEQETGDWHKFLIHMLKYVGVLDVSHTGFASLKIKSNSILDLYMELFLYEVKWLLHTGLVKKYRKTEGNSLALKGSLHFGQHIRHNLTHAERFYVRHTTYDKDHIWNALLCQATELVARIATNSGIASTARSLMVDLPECGEVRVIQSLFDKLIYSRKTEPYRKAIQMARLLLLNYHPDIRSGSEDVLALMFDMNGLWERYVFKQIRRKLAEEYPGKYEVSSQVRTSFWRPVGGHMRIVKPDMVVRDVIKDEVITVLDTKWKHLTDDRPDDNDLKQMLVYNLYQQSGRSALVYPSSNSKKTISGLYAVTQHGSCSLLFLNIDKDDQQGMRLQLGNLIEYVQNPLKNGSS